MSGIITAENLNLWYGNNHALKNINIEIPKGCITALSDRRGAENRHF